MLPENLALLTVLFSSFGTYFKELDYVADITAEVIFAERQKTDILSYRRKGVSHTRVSQIANLITAVTEKRISPKNL